MNDKRVHYNPQFKFYTICENVSQNFVIWGMYNSAYTINGTEGWLGERLNAKNPRVFMSNLS